MIWILVSLSLLANVYAIMMIYGLKGIIKEEQEPDFNIIGSSNKLKYKYTDKGIIFYDKTGKKTLIKGEEL